jgi:hypothetical protein
LLEIGIAFDVCKDFPKDPSDLIALVFAYFEEQVAVGVERFGDLGGDFAVGGQAIFASKKSRWGLKVSNGFVYSFAGGDVRRIGYNEIEFFGNVGEPVTSYKLG